MSASESLYDYHDIDCADCAHKFFVPGNYDFEQENSLLCPKCRHAKKAFDEWWEAEGRNICSEGGML